MKQRKSSSFNRFQHKCAEYASFNRKTISPGMSNVLLAIAHFLNARTLRCFPSYERLAEYAGINRSTVIRNVNRLVAAGIIIKTQEPLSGGGFKNVFGIAFICSDFSVPSGWQNATLQDRI